MDDNTYEFNFCTLMSIIFMFVITEVLPFIELIEGNSILQCLLYGITYVLRKLKTKIENTNYENQENQK